MMRTPFDQAPSRVEDPMTDRQRNYLRDLLLTKARIKGMDADAAAAATEDFLQRDFSKAWASELISRTKADNDRLRALFAPLSIAKKPAVRHELEDGFYMLGETIVKVYHTVHGANKQVGARFAGVLEPKREATGDAKMKPAKIDWKYGGMELANDPRLVRMTPEQAAEFGQVYGRCGRCALPLTRQESIDRGLGPVCASKMLG